MGAWGGPRIGIGRVWRNGRDKTTAHPGFGPDLRILGLVCRREKKPFTRAQRERKVEAGGASVACITKGCTGGAITTMIFRSRHHFDVAIRSEADDNSPRIPNTEEQNDQG